MSLAKEASWLWRKAYEVGDGLGSGAKRHVHESATDVVNSVTKAVKPYAIGATAVGALGAGAHLYGRHQDKKREAARDKNIADIADKLSKLSASRSAK